MKKSNRTVRRCGALDGICGGSLAAALTMSALRPVRCRRAGPL